MRSDWTLDPAAGCWIWQGPLNSHGYGKSDGTSAHRRVYEQLVGEIPEGMELDHLCKVRACVRPAHIELVTRKENCRRRGRRGWRLKSRQTHCTAGHDLYEHGRRTVQGGKVCLLCAPLED